MAGYCVRIAGALVIRVAVVTSVNHRSKARDVRHHNVWSLNTSLAASPSAGDLLDGGAGVKVSATRRSVT